MNPESQPRAGPERGDSIRLRVLLPNEVFLHEDQVIKLTVRSVVGSLGIFPHRRDCVVALTPGVLAYSQAGKGEQYVAVDEGVLVKTGLVVEVAARNAIRGAELGTLFDSVREQFLKLDTDEEQVRFSVRKLESALVRKMVEFQNG